MAECGAEHRCGRGRKPYEGGVLPFVHVELREPEGTEHGEQQRNPASPAGIARRKHLPVEHDRRKHSEAHQVAERVQLLPEVGIRLEGAGGKTVGEIKYGGGQHQIERDVRTVAECIRQGDESAYQIHRRKKIRKILPYRHLTPSFFFRSLVRASLWIMMSRVWFLTNASVAYQMPSYFPVMPQEFLTM